MQYCVLLCCVALCRHAFYCCVMQCYVVLLCVTVYRVSCGFVQPLCKEHNDFYCARKYASCFEVLQQCMRPDAFLTVSYPLLPSFSSIFVLVQKLLYQFYRIMVMRESLGDIYVDLQSRDKPRTEK